MIYPVLILDRHSDPNVVVFEHMDQAHTFAQKMASEFSLDGKYETRVIDNYGTIYSYSPESDMMVVLAKPLLSSLAEAER